ncbi:hypothetical protein F5X99DRAFT_404540 [Biscogniauxia marginata]|nr:hypothetical protein F5X99DRAFT_404540 [Biscogniauxia marginata]
MKTQTILATLAAAGSAFAAAIDARQTARYPISNFKASCTPRTNICSFSFDMVTGMDQSTTCKGNSEKGMGNFGPLANTGCEDPKFAFSVERTPPTETAADDAPVLLLKINVDANPKSAGTHAISKSEITKEQHGAVFAEKYTGPTSFDVQVLPVV